MASTSSGASPLAVGVLWAAFTVSFVVLYLLPGDPVATMASGGLDGEPLSPAELDALRARYGLDQPVIVQYGHRLWAALHGDFGASIQNGQDVRGAILEALPPTIQISLAGLAFAIVFGGAVALVATYTRRSWLRQVLLALPSLAVSLPVFWVGLMLVQVFSFRLRLLPSVGANGLAGAGPAGDHARPADRRAGRAGAREEPVPGARRALRRHRTGQGRRAGGDPPAARAAQRGAPGADRARVRGRATCWPARWWWRRCSPGRASGRLTVTAVGVQDIPLVQGIVVFAAAVFVVVNLLVDLVYPVLDPRIATGSGRMTELLVTGARRRAVPAGPAAARRSPRRRGSGCARPAVPACAGPGSSRRSCSSCWC